MTGTLATRKPLTGYHLKLIALITMFIDHITVVLVPSGTVYLVLRGIGRISFPIYVFLIAEGCRYTSDRFKYAMRLGLFALISEIPYDMALYPKILEQTGWGWNFVGRTNVFYTLFFAVALIHVYEVLRRSWKAGLALIAGELCYTAGSGMFLEFLEHQGVIDWPLRRILLNILRFTFIPVLLLVCHILEKRLGEKKPMKISAAVAVLALLLPLLVAPALEGSYGMFGILVVCLVYLAKTRKWQCIFLALGMLYHYAWPQVLAASRGSEINMVSAVLWPVLALLSAVRIYFAYNGQRGKKAKWGFYAAYPAHLAILAAIRALLKV